MPKIRTRMTLGKAKNHLKRALREIIDPSPSQTELDSLWAYFKGCCAYCGRQLRREAREGQLDHLETSTGGGCSAIGNRVLSCGPCNGDERREIPWREFLRVKCADEKLHSLRSRLIEGWQSANPTPPVAEHLVTAMQSAYKEISEAIDEAVKRLRQELCDPGDGR